jgi:hypothetical protein
LSRREGNYFVTIIIAEKSIEIVKIAAGSPGNHDTLALALTHSGKSPKKVGQAVR